MTSGGLPPLNEATMKKKIGSICFNLAFMLQCISEKFYQWSWKLYRQKEGII